MCSSTVRPDLPRPTVLAQGLAVGQAHFTRPLSCQFGLTLPQALWQSQPQPAIIPETVYHEGERGCPQIIKTKRLLGSP